MDIRKEYRRFLFEIYFTSPHESIPTLVPYVKEKFFVSDVDGVLNRDNSPSLFECYAMNHLNKNLRENSEKICEIGKKIGEVTRKGEKKEIERWVHVLEEEIKSYDLSLKEHLISSFNAAIKLKCENETLETFNKIKRMGYKIILNSGSPQECLDFLIKAKSLPVEKAFGSRWYFKDGKFIGIEPNLADRKVEVMKKLVREELLKDFVFLTDDLKADREVSISVGMVIGIKSKNSKEIPMEICCKNMNEIIDALKRWEKLNMRYSISEPSLDLKIFEKGKEMKNCLKNVERENFLKKAKELLNLIPFSIKEETKKLIFEIERCSNEEKIKHLMNKFLIEVEKEEPLIRFVDDKSFEERLRRIAIEWK